MLSFIVPLEQDQYLYDGAREIIYWSMTPAEFSDNNASVWSVNDDFYYDSVNYYDFLWARPVINLNAGIRITSGSGTASDPYIIE